MHEEDEAIPVVAIKDQNSAEQMIKFIQIA